MELLVCTSPFFLVPPTYSSHLNSYELQSLVPQLCKATILCVGSPCCCCCSLKVSPERKLGWSNGSPCLFLFLRELSPVYSVVQHLKTVISHIFSSLIVVYLGRARLVAFTLMMARSMYLICIMESLIGYPIAVSSPLFPCPAPNCRLKKSDTGLTCILCSKE